MRYLIPTLVTLAGFAVAPTPAPAQDRPPALLPTRDVAVTYRAEGGPGGGPQTMRMSWLVAGQKLRIDPAGGQGWMLIDLRNTGAFVVMDAQRVVMRMTIDGAAADLLRAGPPAGARYTRGGTDTVAGQRCTVWRFEDADTRGTACLTQDGVMLRGNGERRIGSEAQTGRLEATAVSYGPLETARFSVPAGYQSIQMPGGLPVAPPGR